MLNPGYNKAHLSEREGALFLRETNGRACWVCSPQRQKKRKQRNAQMGHCAELSFCFNISEERHQASMRQCEWLSFGGFRSEFFHGSDALPMKNNVENMKLKKNKIFEYSQNWNILIQFVCYHFFIQDWKIEHPSYKSYFNLKVSECGLWQSELCISSDRFWCPVCVGPSLLRDCLKRTKTSNPRV